MPVTLHYLSASPALAALAIANTDETTLVAHASASELCAATGAPASLGAGVDVVASLGKRLITGLPSVLRLLARTSPLASAAPAASPDPLAEAWRLSEIDAWVDYAVANVKKGQTLAHQLAALDGFLKTRTYLVGHKLTVADAALWGQLAAAKNQMESLCRMHNLVHVQRYFDHMHAQTQFAAAFDAHSALAKREAEIKAKAAKRTAEIEKKKESGGVLKDTGGSFDIGLQDAKMGEVCTRFPPEPSGYLHIGHAKAALLNDYFAKEYKGKLIVRFDDTNPSKEKDEFVDNIMKDIKTLGINYACVTYTSDHFEDLIKMGKKLIEQGKMYVDDTDVDTMRDERMKGIESKCRNLDVKENLRRWDEMLAATEFGQTCAARFKMDMKNNNKTLRDPVAFRTNLTPHHRTGTKYKCYPTYDCACPFVDAKEGVTHALRTTEYKDREAQYYWVTELMGVRKVHIWEFARVNFIQTVMSKRKLQWFVDQGIVDGWYDPRFPTVQGMVRRGLTIAALREFMLTMGASRNVINLEWDKLFVVNKRVIDPTCPRHTAVSRDRKVMWKLSDGPAEVEYRTVPKHKKNESLGTKLTAYSNKILIDLDDAVQLENGMEVTLMDWGNAIVDEVVRSGDSVVEIKGHLHLEGDVKTTKLKLTWLADTPELVPVQVKEFGMLVTVKKIEEDTKIEDVVNKNSLKTYYVLGDANMRGLQHGQHLQLERKGFFYVDKAYTKEGEPMILHFVPSSGKDFDKGDGNKKEAAAPAKKQAPAAAAADGGGKKKEKKEKKEKGAAAGGEGRKGPPSAEEIAAMKAAKQAEIEKKLIKDVTKEGGKKGVEIEGAADMGGLEFFCTTMEKPDGELKFLKMSMEAMNEVPDPEGEERRGGSGHVGKMLFSAGTEAMSMVAYVPKDKQDRINATEWLKSVCGDAGVKGELQAGGDAGLATAIAKANPDAGMFTIKMKDAAMAHGFSYLRERGCFPEDTGDDDDDDGEYVYGDDDFPS